MRQFLGIMMLTMVVSIVGATVIPPTPTPNIPGFPVCPATQFQNGSFIFGDHASHHGPDDWHGLIGDILPDGTVIPALMPDPNHHGHNVHGFDDTYCVGSDPQDPCAEVLQCLCSTDTRTVIVNGVPQDLVGWGVQTQWRIANSCSEATPLEVCALHGADWNVRFWLPYPNSSPPAIALHSTLYPCRPWCGDGVVQTNGASPEECDNGKQCSNGASCSTDATCVGIGDGHCTMRDGDGCDANCNIEHFCGNGIVEQGEQCDDGNQVNTDACHNDCTPNICGDGVVNIGVEQCDDGNTNNMDACHNNCTINICGDGVVNAEVEQCDDGNTINGDGCDSNCHTEEVCTDLVDNDGDGLVDCVDPDCMCHLFERDPARIVYSLKNPLKDQFKASGGVIPGEPFMPENEQVCFMLANATQGSIWSACLLPGDLIRGANMAKRWKFKDPTAKTGPGTRGGLYEVSVGSHGGPTQYIVRLLAYGEFSGITDLYLTVEVVIGDQVWASTGPWQAGLNSIKVNFVH